MKTTLATLALLLLAVSLSAAPSTNNDDTCDIAAFPAATLLLPYFQVDIHSSDQQAQTTLFTVTNVGAAPQIANVTIWTDYAYPVLTFDLFLTGYDVQSINLRDVLVRGTIGATSSGSQTGGYSKGNRDNPNFLEGAEAACANPPHLVAPEILAEVRQILTLGLKPGCGDNVHVGGTHLLASGYLTVDLVATCSSFLPSEPAYFDQLLYDNVLTGDYQYVLPNPVFGNFASGEPLVHIRAIPEGGRAGTAVATALPFTFYDRFLPDGKRLMDRRQPLPSAWASRWIQGGSGGFNTDLVLWRESTAAGSASCGDVARGVQSAIVDMVRFDERENPTAVADDCGLDDCGDIYSIPAAARVSTFSDLFPAQASADVHGWMYLNLDNGGSEAYSAAPGRNFTHGSSTTTGPRPGQSWLLPLMEAEGRYSAAIPATALANGCTPSPARNRIAPAANATP